MKLNFGLLIGLILAVTLVGCVSQEKKKAENTPEPSAKVKNFERAVPPAMMTDPQERAGYIIMHFWDKFDFRDTMYCHTPDITEQALVDFISLFPHASYGKVSEGVKKMLDSAEVDEVMYNYFYKKAEHYLYNPNSPMRNDEYYIPFLEHIIASSKVGDTYKIRPQHLLNLAYRNRVGGKAEDVVYTTASGKTGRLYDLSAKYVLLMFYNPDCVECQHTTEMLKNSSAVSSAVSSGKLKVLAVYPDENLDAWRDHMKDIPSSWINGYDKALVLRNGEIYDLKAIPTLYLLDENKKVILKDTSTGNIHEYLERNQ
ncbi:MAG: DUF5106 domain-containing protein [Tannerella sp.]|jgi:thiol-disulfide isomerase/thioredoxin|nr:DUF5106 domain-containing protein [Tannerella sp.]